MKQNYIFAVIIALGTCLMLHGEAATEHFYAYKKELVETMRKADQQNEGLQALLNNKAVDLKELSIDQVTETIKKLEQYIERLIAQKQRYLKLGEQEARCLILAQELVRQLTNARIAYTQRVKTAETIKKVSISAGAAIAVFGGLMLLNTLTPLDITVSTALLCGVATGVAVGVITQYGALRDSVKSLADTMQQGAQNPLTIGTKAAVAVGAVALVSGLVWARRDLILDRLPSRKRGGTSLDEMMKRALPEGENS